MSELNNFNKNGYKSRKKKKMNSTLKVILIILLIFTIISGIITLGAIANYKSYLQKESDNKNKNNKTDGQDYGITSLNERFRTNNLEISSLNYTKGEKVTQADGYSYYPLNVDYLKIEGLRDTNIQNKINKELREAAIDFVSTEELNNADYKAISVSSECTANYSNVLSIILIKNIQIKEYRNIENLDTTQYIGLNFDLNTGDKLELEDIFTANTNIKNILSKQAYRTVAINEYMQTEKIVNLDEATNPTILEDKVFEIMNKYNKNENVQFNFSKTDINVYIENYCVQIPMKEYYSNVAIYKKYASDKNIYNNKFTNQKEAYIFANYDPIIYDYSNINEIQDGLFVNIRIKVDDRIDKTKVKKTLNNIIKQKEDEISSQKEYLNSNQDKAIINSEIINISYQDIGEQEDKYKLSIKEEKMTYVLNKTYYNLDKILNKIQTITQDYENMYFDFEDETQAQKEYTVSEKIYDIYTGEEYVPESENNTITNDIISQNTQTNTTNTINTTNTNDLVNNVTNNDIIFNNNNDIVISNENILN